MGTWSRGAAQAGSRPLLYCLSAHSKVWPVLLQVAACSEAGWMERLLGFYEAIMLEGQVLPTSGSLGQAAAQPSIPAEVYSTVLLGKHLRTELPGTATTHSISHQPFTCMHAPNHGWLAKQECAPAAQGQPYLSLKFILPGVMLAGVQHALPAVAPDRRRSLLAAARQLAARVSASSPVRAATLRFQAAFLARPEVFYPDPGTGLPLIEEAGASSWLQVQLPAL